MKPYIYQNQAYGRGKRYGRNIGILLGFILGGLTMFVICNYKLIITIL